MWYCCQGKVGKGKPVLLKEKKGSSFLTDGIGATGYTHARKYLIHTWHQIKNSKWNIVQNVKSETIKFLKENVGEKYCDFGLGKDLQDMIVKAKFIKQNIKKLDFIKLKVSDFLMTVKRFNE